MQPLRECSDPSPDEFQSNILPTARPVVMRGLARQWPLVQAAKAGSDPWLGMLAKHATSEPIEVLRADPVEGGRFHYRPDGASLNFSRGPANLPMFLGALRELSKSERPPAIVVQGLGAGKYLPGFSDHHPMPLVPPGTQPRMWIGNASTVATHNDPVDNIAVVVAGRRRFTLFPPEQETNLYMGPSDPTPAGTRVSMVHVTGPDFKRYPRFQAAIAEAQEAVLSPGDALFIPRDWFHHVQALEPFNMLVNYWWDSSGQNAGIA